MLNERYASFLLRSVLICVLASSPAMAQERKYLPPLSNSMSFHDVLKAWGTPKEKEEHESRRQDVWVYSGGRVIFQDGRVAAWFNEDVPVAVAKSDAPEKSTYSNKEPETSDDSAAAVEEILRDILKEPAAPGAAAPNAPPSAGGMMKNLRPPTATAKDDDESD